MAWLASRNARLLASGFSAVSAAAFLRKKSSHDTCGRPRHSEAACSALQPVGTLSSHMHAIPETVCPTLASTLCSSISKDGNLFDCEFYATKQEFDDAWRWSWTLVGVEPIDRSQRKYEARKKSTADSSNRLQDKERVETTWNLQESGDPFCEFYDKAGELIARGYDAIVYGDHGPYLEFREEQIHWPSLCYHKLKGPGRTHFEHYNKDQSVKCYDQFQTVANQPNPPDDNPFSVANNRPDGYADYRPGRLYISCDFFFGEGGKYRRYSA
eukprot:Skav230962  [mRNA]  locus=scaffold644:10337:11146:+ [translate_table: standard]